MNLPNPLVPGVQRPRTADGIALATLVLVPVPTLPSNPEQGQLVALTDGRFMQYLDGVWVNFAGGGGGFLTQAAADVRYRFKGSYVFAQNTPSALWVINHNLSSKPAVTVEDSSHNIIEGDVRYVDDNNLTITFTAPFSGNAYLA